ncbi:MAG: hypothetical protein JWR69_91 [Pedosphaera sp.]|nr:hypothetical protein [Pedosphaera sp.]
MSQLNAQQREQVRLSILRYLDGAAPHGISVGLLLQFLRNEGLRLLTKESLEAELLYLADKRLADVVNKQISPENPTWRITATGRDLVAQGA